MTTIIYLFVSSGDFSSLCMNAIPYFRRNNNLVLTLSHDDIILIQLYGLSIPVLLIGSSVVINSSTIKWIIQYS